MRRIWFLFGLVVGLASVAVVTRGPFDKLDAVTAQLETVRNQLRGVEATIARIPPRLSEAKVTLHRITKVVDPVDAAGRPGESALYIATRPGMIYKVDPHAYVDDPRLALDISRLVDTQGAKAGLGGEAGVLGLTFSPDGHRLYVSYTAHWSRSSQSVIWTLVEFRMRGNDVVAASRRRLLTAHKLYPHHNGGHLAFGPDGYLYASIGDGSPFGDQLHTGQNPDDLLGSVLRIDPEQSGERPYSVPSDNPFIRGGGAPEVWAYGLRNPWRFSFDRVTGDLWIADVGDHKMEEIDMVTQASGGGRGANFGWPVLEGTELRGDEEPRAYVPPVHVYVRHSPFCALIGGYVYRGSAIPPLRGAYLYTDYCESGVYAFAGSGDATTVRSLGLEVASPSSFAEDDDGEVYVLSLKGDVYRIEPA
jgi:hypothetical protein